MDTTVNEIVMATAILIAMVFVSYVALNQSDRTICSDITSLTEATANDIAMALKYASFASANQVVKKFDFPDRFQIDLTKDDLTVKYTGPCPDSGEHTIEHNVKRIKPVTVEDSKNKKRTGLCIKKYFVDCEPVVTICLASDPDCCVVEPSDCGGYPSGMTFLDTYTNKVEWVGDISNKDDSDDITNPNTYMVEDFECSGEKYSLVNEEFGYGGGGVPGIWLVVLKVGETGTLYDDFLYLDEINEIDSAISVKITDSNIGFADPSDWFVFGEVVCGEY
ncbi:hypothetical protein GQ473_07035 [archaeon]|nr:hypothetical protein [archaeon]